MKIKDLLKQKKTEKPEAKPISLDLPSTSILEMKEWWTDFLTKTLELPSNLDLKRRQEKVIKLGGYETCKLKRNLKSVWGHHLGLKRGMEVILVDSTHLIHLRGVERSVLKNALTGDDFYLCGLNGWLFVLPINYLNLKRERREPELWSN